MERRDIFRRVLENPRIYTAYQSLLGAHAGRQRLAAMLGVQSGMRVLDLGCGPADLLDYLPDIDYVGVDYSHKYIDAARRRFGDRGQFFVADASTVGDHVKGDFDLVMAIGILHHLDDGAAGELMRAARQRLRAGGRFFALDPLIEYPQNPIARVLARLDRGQFVRTLDGYSDIARSAFDTYVVEPKRDMARIPYSHAVTRCAA